MFLRFSAFLVMSLLLAGCVLTPSEAHHSVTGTVAGRVLDADGHPVARAHVTAVYKRSWTWIAVPNWLVVGEAYTDATGQFRIVTHKRVDALSASSLHPYRSGTLDNVVATGNAVRLLP